MGESNSASQPSPPRDHRAVSSTRRTFMTRVIGGLAIAIPGFRVLVGTVPATAASTIPRVNSCNFIVYRYHYCGSKNTCPQGSKHTCWGHYDVYDGSGNYCYSFRDNEGPCK